MGEEQTVTGSAQICQFESNLPILSCAISPVLYLFLNIDHENIITGIHITPFDKITEMNGESKTGAALGDTQNCARFSSASVPCPTPRREGGDLLAFDMELLPD